jgi:acetate kinase
MGAALDGIDAVAFTRVGEHSATVGAARCARLGFLGVELDSDLNEGATPDADIAAAGSAVRVLVIAAREVLVARSAVRAPLDPST